MKVYFGTDWKDPKIQTRTVLGGRVPEMWFKDRTEEDKVANGLGDIAVLRFLDEAPLGYYPVRVMTSPQLLQKGLPVTLAGYGLTDMQPEQVDPFKLMKADVTLADAAYSKSEILFDFSNGKGACHGDSGGPAYATLNGKLTVIGVTSRAPNFAGALTCEEGAIYSSIAAHMDFIRKAARDLNSKNFVQDEVIPRPSKGF